MSDDNEQVFIKEMDLEDTISRAADFLHAHGPFVNVDPAALPPTVGNSILHLAEHLVRYLGVSPDGTPFFTPHQEWCDDDYFRYVDIAEELRRMGVPPHLSREDQVKFMRNMKRDSE